MHPYRGLPASNFWRKSVVGQQHLDFDPVVSSTLKITRDDGIVTAGSCFAQHIARSLAADGNRFMVTEEPGEAEVAAGASIIYSARYGNIYTSRQLVQLFERAYGLKEPADRAWLRPDGRFVDPFRPNEFPLGFDTIEDVELARERHYAAVRRAFEQCSIFVFTLGLTEAWISDVDGMAVPLAPGVVANPAGDDSYHFANLTADEVTADLTSFLALMREINPDVRTVLTVSPVPLEATYTGNHVLVATTLSKAILRVAAEQVKATDSDRITYFPSYEMVSAFPGGQSFEADLRSVRPEVVAHVMSVFKRHHVGEGPDPRAEASAVQTPDAPATKHSTPADLGLDRIRGVVCDEELLGRV